MNVSQELGLPPEVVAAIAVAVAEYLQTTPEHVHLQDVRPLAEAPLWALAGRLEQMSRRQLPGGR